jgi:hypothetical protein
MLSSDAPATSLCVTSNRSRSHFNAICKSAQIAQQAMLGSQRVGMRGWRARLWVGRWVDDWAASESEPLRFVRKERQELRVEPQ